MRTPTTRPSLNESTPVTSMPQQCVHRNARPQVTSSVGRIGLLRRRESRSHRSSHRCASTGTRAHFVPRDFVHLHRSFSPMQFASQYLQSFRRGGDVDAAALLPAGGEPCLSSSVEYSAMPYLLICVMLRFGRICPISPLRAMWCRRSVCLLQQKYVALRCKQGDTWLNSRRYHRRR